MSKDKDYRLKHELEHERAVRYTERMRKTKNRSFRKFKNAGEKDKQGSKRNLQFSEYDDKIDTEPVIRIPIVYHVLYENSDQNLGDAQLQSQVDVLNKDFRALNSEIVDGKVAKVWQDRVGDSKIEFYINTTNRVSIDDASTTCLDETKMKVSSAGGSDAKNPKYFLNVWICDISSEGLLGMLH